MRKILFWFLIFLLFLDLLLFLSKDWLVKGIFETAIRGVTGFEAKAERLRRLDPAKGVLQLEGLTVFNPREFEERVFVRVPEIYIWMDLPSLLRRERIHIHHLKLVIRELNVEKSRRGITNVSLLKGTSPSAERRPSSNKPAMPFYLERLEFSLRRVSYQDRSSVMFRKLSVDLKIEKELIEGIRDPQSIVNVILLKVITGTPFGNLGLNPSEIEERLRTTWRETRDLGEKLAGRAEGVAKTTAGEAKEAFGQAQVAAKERLGNLLKKFQSQQETEGLH